MEPKTATSHPSTYLYFKMIRQKNSIIKYSLVCILVLSVYIYFIGDNSNSSSNNTVHTMQVVEKIIYRDPVINHDQDSLYTNGHHWKLEKKLNLSNLSQHDKFVIFDSEKYSGSLQFLNNIPTGWSVFVVNSEGESQTNTCPNCMTFVKSTDARSVLEKVHHLSDAKEIQLSTSVKEKMAASIFATKSNAPWIYVTDKPGTVPFDTLTRISKNHPMKGMVYRGPKTVFQPCSHFVDPFTWHGLENVPREEKDSYTLRPLSMTSLYQIVDECYRTGMDINSWQKYMDLQAPTPFVMPGTWAAVDFNNVFVPSNAAWTLIASALPKITTTSSTPAATAAKSSATTTIASSSVRGVLSLIVQRLLWETQTTIAFVPGNSDSIKSRNNECPTCHVENEMSSVLDRGTKVMVNQWSCKSSNNYTLGQCLNMIVSSKDTDIFLNGEARKLLKNLVSTWVGLFEEYKLPYEERTPLTDAMMNERNNGPKLYFTPAKSLHKENSNGDSFPPNAFRDFCGNNNQKYKSVIPDHHPEIFNNVLLIISFNFPKFLNSISFLEFMFGRQFKHILYCSESITEFEKQYLHKYSHNPVSFVDTPIHRGYFGHLCVVSAIEMNYNNITGYLYFSDDVIVNAWNLYHQPYHLPWFQTDIRVVDLKSTFTRGHDYAVDWYPWNKPTGKPAIKKSIDLLKSLQNDPKIGRRVKWFLDNLKQMSSGCDYCIAYMDADFYYIPSYMGDDFKFFVPYFTGVFQELSVPTLLSGITPQADLNIYRLRGSYLVGNFKRDNFEKAWSYVEIFVHPVKYSAVGQPGKTRNLFCAILRRNDEDLARGIK